MRKDKGGKERQKMEESGREPGRQSERVKERSASALYPL